MSPKRFALACSVLFVVALVWNGLLHLVLLRGVEAAVRHLYRPDLGDRMGLSLLLTACLVLLFVWGYGRFARNGTIREGVVYGAFFGLLAGVLVDFNQYLVFPIPGRLALLWFAGGLAEFIVYGVIVSRILRVSGEAR